MTLSHRGLRVVIITGQENTARAGEELTVVIYLSLIGLRVVVVTRWWASCISPKMTLSHGGLRVVIIAGQENTAHTGKELTVVIYLNLIGLRVVVVTRWWASFIISPKMTLSHGGLRVVIIALSYI